MAIVFSYPPIGKNDVQPSDRLLLSQMTVTGNPTRSLTVNNLRQYLGAIIPTNIVTGTGTTNTITKWKAPVGSGEIEDSGITDDGTAVTIPYKLLINNATSGANGLSFEHPAGGASGVVQMYYAGAAAGSRFTITRAATGGAEIELQSNGDVNINRVGNGSLLVGGNATFNNDATVNGVFTSEDALLKGLDSFADDAAAAAAGLASDTVYQTNGAGAAPLNVAGILMVKQ